MPFLLFICTFSQYYSYMQLDGVEKIYPIGELSADEQELLAACLPDLKANIEKGKEFVDDHPE